jgi:hypothetical protein
MLKRIIAVFIFILLFLNPSLAEISCRRCEVGNCVCEITDCDSGIFDVFLSTSCTLEPDYEYTFSQGFIRWSPLQAASYYVKALCSDGQTQSDCTLVTVKAQAAVTTTKTTQPRTTQVQQTTTTSPPPKTEGPDYLLWVLVILLIIALLFAVYYFFFMKKGRKTYEELYRKWGRRR